MKLLSVEDARGRMLAAVPPPTPERVRFAEALGRTLAAPVVAARDQPPYPASAMDGWAIRSERAEMERVTLRIVGESAAGKPFLGEVAEGEAVRIFTGAAVPDGCSRVVPQEDAERVGGAVALGPRVGEPRHLRPRGGDFRAGAELLMVGERLDAWRLSLAAAAGAAELTVARRPRVAILSTGEEIVPIGGAPGPHQIYDSGSPALAARAGAWGAAVQALHPAGDDEAPIAAAVEAVDADLLVTIGGASVGDHDLVKPALKRLGLTLSVESVAVRPGKPTWFGQLADGRRVLGLPGNPASALVCAELFLGPLLLAWQGAEPGPILLHARVAHALPPPGQREHWMRARLLSADDGSLEVTALADQDSSLVTVFAQADALLRRPAGAPGLDAGDLAEVLRLDRL